LASAGIASSIGLVTEPVQVAPLTRSITRNTEVEYNANRYARLPARAAGIVAEVRKDLGERAETGESLAVVDSVEVGGAKAEVLQAVERLNLWTATVAQERSLVAQGVGTQREMLAAETRLAESRIELSKARQRLRTLGLTAAAVEQAEKTGDTSSLLDLVSPLAGIVVERAAVVGEAVPQGAALLSVADTSTMWAVVDLMESDTAGVRVGQGVVVTLDGLPGRGFAGTLTWLSTQIDPKTRTIKARAEVANPDGLLRAHMFGRAEIHTRRGEQATMVPKEAVQWEGCCNIVFVDAGEEGAAYRPVKVHLGYETPTHYEVLSGLSGGERIVTQGSYLLKTEILKGSIGAGCCEVDHLAK